MVLIPEAYYAATILQEKIYQPCTVPPTGNMYRQAGWVNMCVVCPHSVWDLSLFDLKILEIAIYISCLCRWKPRVTQYRQITVRMLHCMKDISENHSKLINLISFDDTLLSVCLCVCQSLSVCVSDMPLLSECIPYTQYMSNRQHVAVKLLSTYWTAA